MNLWETLTLIKNRYILYNLDACLYNVKNPVCVCLCGCLCGCVSSGECPIQQFWLRSKLTVQENIYVLNFKEHCFTGKAKYVKYPVSQLPIA